MDTERMRMKARRRARFITGGESTLPGCFTGRGARVGRTARATIWQHQVEERAAARQRRAVAGFDCRLATPQERDQWPQLRAEQCHWLVQCRRCPDWAYGQRKLDVREWGRAHLRSAHPGRNHRVGPAARREALPDPKGVTVRHATSQDRRAWPQVAIDGGNWLAECACGDWAYGVTKADVKAWAGKHGRRAHNHRA